MRRTRNFLLFSLFLVLLAGGVVARAEQGMTLSISPAVIMLKGLPGHTTTQPFTISNMSEHEFSFEVELLDVVVREGKRVFTPAGETAHGLAGSASLSQKQITLAPRTEATIKATLVMPTDSPLRAVVVMFRGRQKVPAGTEEKLGSRAGLGSLVTFSVSNAFEMAGNPASVSAQTASRSAVISQVLKNTGTEPIMPTGIAAVLNQGGKMVGKAVFVSHRLLPDEQLEFAADYPTQLDPGKYYALCSFEYEGKTLITKTEFMVE
jgi:hypothetical protein